MEFELTHDEIAEGVDYTMQKIESYPKHLGKTIENYFDLLFPDEVKNYLYRREVNRHSAIMISSTKG